MLKFDSSFTYDPEVDAFLRNFINNALKKAVCAFIECYEQKDDEECYFPMLTYYDGLLDPLFPDSYPGKDEDKLIVLKGLYSLLNADNEFVPTLVMEYVLAKIIDINIEQYDEFFADEDDEDFGILPFDGDEIEVEDRIPDKSVNCPFTKKTRKKIIKAYTEMYLDESDADEKDFCKAHAEEMADSLWHFSEDWLEFCFWDDDYMMLDVLSPWQLSQSEVNAVTGAIPENPIDDAFYLPEDWKNSKDFHFLNRE